MGNLDLLSRPMQGRVLVTVDTPFERSGRSAARDRILETADRLFYGEGIRSVGVDRIVVDARVTRVTFYRHFPSKDHLIAAYLHGRLHSDQEELAGLRTAHPDDPRAVLSGLVQLLGAEISRSDFRGCPYANLASEYSEPEHPARDIAAEHRRWLLHEVQDLLTDMGAARPDIVAEQLVMLRAGAMAVCSVGSPDNVQSALVEAWTTLIGQSTSH